MKLSLIVPCYNEADNVTLFRDTVMEAFSGCGYDYEIIFIDDGNVIDVGTHIELYNRCKDYKNMVELQRITALEADI